MPTYVYRREDGTTFETEQRISEDPLSVCPTTGQNVKRLITPGAGFVLKGSGFYVTDYVRTGNKADSGKPAKPAKTKSEGESEAKPASTPESKPAASTNGSDKDS